MHPEQGAGASRPLSFGADRVESVASVLTGCSRDRSSGPSVRWPARGPWQPSAFLLDHLLKPLGDNRSKVWETMIERTANVRKRAVPPPPEGHARREVPTETQPDAATEKLEPAGKRRLLDAAAIEFSERGFDGASVLAIARRAEVKQPLLNYYFSGKEGLWRAVVEDGYMAVRERMAAVSAPTDEDPLTRLKQLLLAFAEVNLARPAVHAIMQRETMSAGPRADWLVDNFMLPFNQKLATLVDECVKEGILKPIPTAQACIMLTGIQIAFFIARSLPNRMYGGVDMTSDKAAQSYIDNAVEAILTGMLVNPRTFDGTQPRSAKRSR